MEGKCTLLDFMNKMTADVKFKYSRQATSFNFIIIFKVETHKINHHLALLLRLARKWKKQLFNKLLINIISLMAIDHCIHTKSMFSLIMITISVLPSILEILPSIPEK